MTIAVEQHVKDTSFQRAAAMLPVHDVERSAEYYRARLGFTICGVWKAVPYAIVRRGYVEIHFCGGDVTCDPRRGGVYVFVDDADAVYDELATSGAQPLGRPENKFYHQRDFGVRDPDGHLIMFSSPATVPNQTSQPVQEVSSQ